MHTETTILVIFYVRKHNCVLVVLSSHVSYSSLISYMQDSLKWAGTKSNDKKGTKVTLDLLGPTVWAGSTRIDSKIIFRDLLCLYQAKEYLMCLDTVFFLNYTQYF